MEFSSMRWKFISVFCIFSLSPFLFSDEIIDLEEERVNLLKASAEFYLYDEDYLAKRAKRYLEYRPNDYYVYFNYHMILDKNHESRVNKTVAAENELRKQKNDSIVWLYASFVGMRIEYEAYERDKGYFYREFKKFEDLLKTFPSRKIFNLTLPFESGYGKCPSADDWREIKKLDLKKQHFLHGDTPRQMLLTSHFYYSILGNCIKESKEFIDIIDEQKSELNNHKFILMTKKLLILDRKLRETGSFHESYLSYRQILNEFHKEDLPEFINNSLNFRIAYICQIINTCARTDRDLFNDYSLFGKEGSYQRDVVNWGIYKLRNSQK